ncbi:MAG: NUDIX domain-containing protein, partial [Wenzhouxiangella sp.]
IARREDLTGEIPGRRRSPVRPRRRVRLALVENGHGQLLLERRSPTGVWGGLWCLPDADELDPAFTGQNPAPVDRVDHALTHFIMELELHRLPPADSIPIEDGEKFRWIGYEAALELGLPKPVRTMLEKNTGARR